MDAYNWLVEQKIMWNVNENDWLHFSYERFGRLLIVKNINLFCDRHIG